MTDLAGELVLETRSMSGVKLMLPAVLDRDLVEASERSFVI